MSRSSEPWESSCTEHRAQRTNFRLTGECGLRKTWYVSLGRLAQYHVLPSMSCYQTTSAFWFFFRHMARAFLSSKHYSEQSRSSRALGLECRCTELLRSTKNRVIHSGWGYVVLSESFRGLDAPLRYKYCIDSTVRRISFYYLVYTTVKKDMKASKPSKSDHTIRGGEWLRSNQIRALGRNVY